MGTSIAGFFVSWIFPLSEIVGSWLRQSPMLAVRLLLILLPLAYMFSSLSRSFSLQAGQRVLGETGTRSIRERNWFFVSNVKATYLRLKQFPLAAIIFARKSVPGF